LAARNWASVLGIFINQSSLGLSSVYVPFLCYVPFLFSHEANPG
jgi:hypothetical protein